MWKDWLKRLVPALRQRSTVLRLHQLVDAARSIPAALRMCFRDTDKSRAINLLRRDKRVVFISERPLRREAKFAYALKRAGWDVVLLQRYAPNVNDFSDFCDVQTFSSPWEAVELAHRTKARVFHSFSASYDNTSVCLVENKPGRVIVDLYDYFYGISDGLPAMRERHALDIAKQSFCIENADAVCSPDMQLQYRRRETNIARDKLILHFPNYCWDRDPLPEPRRDDEIHVVQIGWMGFETKGEEDTGCFRVAREFVNAGCQFHIYLHPEFPKLDTPMFKALFADYLNLASDTGRVHFHATVPTRRLIAELTSYDFGFAMINGSTYKIPWRHHNPNWFPFVGSSRLFDYIDAGLGILIDEGLTYMRRTFRPLALNGSELVRDRRIRETLSRKPSRAQVLSVRNSLSIRNQIYRLTKFYENVA